MSVASRTQRKFLCHFLIAACCSFTASSFASACAYLNECWGPSDVAAVTGNGGLTVGVNPFGRVSLCRWPSPSYYNQIRYRAHSKDLAELGVPPEDGLMWGLRIQNQTLWLKGPPWKTAQTSIDEPGAIEMESSLPGSAMSVVQHVLVMPEQDFMVCHLVVRDAPEAPTLFFYANFSPCTRLIPQWPVADWLYDAWNDFAAFTPDSGKTIYHFRPYQPGRAEWEAAETVAAKKETGLGDWARFGDGTWIGYTTSNTVTAFQCGIDSAARTATARTADAPSAFVQADAGALSLNTAAVGACNSAMELIPDAGDKTFTATISIAFGANQHDVRDLLEVASSNSYETLFAAASQYWQSWLDKAELPPKADAATLAECRRDLLAVDLAMDRGSGAIVRSPLAQPPLALDWPRDGAYATLALDMAGLHDLAERHLLFYPPLLRKKAERGMPVGSLPAAAYANHVEGVPYLVLDEDAAAWLLGSCVRHASMLNDTAARRFAGRMNAAVFSTADFLVNWADARTGMPQFSFDPGSCKDARTVKHLLTIYMGIDGALRMLTRREGPVPEEWKRRKRDLDRLIRFTCVDEKGQWKDPATLPFWRAEFAQTQLPSWEPLAEEKLASVQPGEMDLAETCETALILQNKPQHLKQMIPFLDAAPRPATPDTLAAAQHFIAASIIYGEKTRKE